LLSLQTRNDARLSDRDVGFGATVLRDVTESDMAMRSIPELIAAVLTAPERNLLVCLASDIDWTKASVTHMTARRMMVGGLIERDRAGVHFVLSERGRAVLKALMMTAG
jgi:hypothetical protein